MSCFSQLWARSDFQTVQRFQAGSHKVRECFGRNAVRGGVVMGGVEKASLTAPSI